METKAKFKKLVNRALFTLLATICLFPNNSARIVLLGNPKLIYDEKRIRLLLHC